MRLDLDAEGMRIAPNGRLLTVFLHFILPAYNVPWHDVERAERLSRGIRIVIRSLDAPVIFWTNDPELVLDALAAHGVIVERQTQPAYGGLPRPHFGPPTRRKMMSIGVAILAVLIANVMLTVAPISPGPTMMPIRLLLIVMSIIYVAVAIFVPDDFWTRGRG